MHSCDALVANLTPFRGVSADAGTAFEVGFMRALGRPVLGYTYTGLAYVERPKPIVHLCGRLTTRTATIWRSKTSILQRTL